MFLLISDYLGDDDAEASNKPCFPPLVSSDTILAFGMFVCNKCDFKVWTNNDDNGANQPDLGQLEEACERVSVMYI